MVLLSYLSRRSAAKAVSTRSLSSSSSALPSWATIDPKALGSQSDPYAVHNMCNGQWKAAAQSMEIPHPLDRDAHPIFTVADTGVDEIGPFVDSLRQCPKTGLHNPLKNPERYVEYGEITRRVRETSERMCSSWNTEVLIGLARYY